MYKKPNILVCVTKQITCENLIKEGYLLKKDIENSELYILHITNKNLTENDESIIHLFDIGKKYDATMSIVSGNNPISEIKKYVKKNKISHIIVGETRYQNPYKSTMYKLQKELGDFAEVIVVPIQESYLSEDLI